MAMSSLSCKESIEPGTLNLKPFRLVIYQGTLTRLVLIFFHLFYYLPKYVSCFFPDKHVAYVVTRRI